MSRHAHFENSGGSRSSRYAYASDSALGSSGDERTSRPTNPGRPLTAEDVSSIWNSHPRLQNAYREVYNSNVVLYNSKVALENDNNKLYDDNIALKRDLSRLTDDNSQLHKRKQELDEQNKALERKCSTLKEKKSQERLQYEEDREALKATIDRLNNALFRRDQEIKKLNEDNALLRGQVNYLQTQPPAPSSSSSDKTRSSTNAVAGSSSKRSSKHQDQEKEELRKRFDKPSRRMSVSSKGGAYIESFGPPVTRAFENYSTTPMQAPVMAPPLASPTYAAVPRTQPMHPVVTVAVDPTLVAPTQPYIGEDGNYHEYPLPPAGRRR